MKNYSFILILCQLIFLAGCGKESGWSPDLPVNVRDFTEAEKEIQRKNGKVLVDSLNNLKKENPDAVTIIELTDDCRFPGDGSFILSGLENAEIRGASGKDITFWFDSPHVFGMKLTDCKNVVFENITFDCDPVPFTQGKIIEIKDSASFTVEPMKGYETLISNANGAIILFNPDGSFKLHTHRTGKIIQSADKKIAVTDTNMPFAKVGDYVVFPSRTGSMISLSNCSKIKFHQVNVYSSGGMCCVADKGEGGHVFDHFIATRRPGTNRLFSFGADGFHINELEKGPIIENSEMSYTADDLINIHGRFGWVCAKNDASGKNLRVVFSKNAVKVGQQIDFWDNETQLYKGNASVIKITPIVDPGEIEAARKGMIDHVGGDVYDILLDKSVDADKASLMEHHANVCSGFIVRNCKLHDTFNRGFLINGANDGLIEGNDIYNVGSGQSFHMESWNYCEGQYIRNLTVKNNRFKNAGALWFSIVPPGGNLIYGAFRTTPMRNIAVKDNTIELTEDIVCGINVNYTAGVEITGNTIIRNAKDQIPDGSDVNFTDGYGRSLTDAIFVSTCKDVKIDNNKITDRVENSYKNTGYGILIENITIDGVKQPNCIADIASGWLLNGIQNDFGWSYGYTDADLIRTGKYNSDRFKKMTKYENGNWSLGTLESPVIGKQYLVPGPDKLPVVRLVSAVNGNLNVKGKIASQGTGALCYFYVNGEKRYEYDINAGSIDLNIDLGAVSEGAYIDFVVDSHKPGSKDPILFNYRFLSSANPDVRTDK